MDMQDGKPTEVNPNAVPLSPQVDDGGEGIAVVNPAASPIAGNNTIVNPVATLPTGGNHRTVVNPSAPLPGSSGVVPYIGNHGCEDSLGLMIEGYKLTSVIATTSGEADLYICEDESGTQFCLKHYKRLDSVSEEVHKMFQDINDPYIAKLVNWGYWDDRIYEVWPFFSKGSLAGQAPDNDTLKKYVEQMNIAIASIHRHGIIHQDIKPANFMINDSGDIALIDFGTSAIIGQDADQRTHVTKIGQTTDYASPEVLFSRYCWPASDYYSLGVTIYELLLGTTPYADYDENMLQRKIDDMRDTRVPNVDKLPKEYQDLINGLLRYERELRWGYEQICDWLSGNYRRWIYDTVDTAPIPGKQFRFDGTVYRIPAQLSQLVVNMAYQWDMGKNLFDGDGRFIRMCKALEDMEGTEDLYALCNAPKATRNEDDDINYFRKLYQLSPELKLFAWRKWHFEDKKALGLAILNSLWASEVDKATGGERTTGSIFGEDASAAAFPSHNEVVYWARNHIISKYLRFVGEGNLANTISALEDHAQNDILSCFRIAYKLSESTELQLPSGTFSNKVDFLRFVEKKAQESDKTGDVDAFLRFCRSDIYDGRTIAPGFQAWVERLGLEKALDILTDENFAQQVERQQTERTSAKKASAGSVGAAASSAQSSVATADGKYITLICSACSGRFSYPKSFGETSARCPYCGSYVLIE